MREKTVVTCGAGRGMITTEHNKVKFRTLVPEPVLSLKVPANKQHNKTSPGYTLK